MTDLNALLIKINEINKTQVGDVFGRKMNGKYEGYILAQINSFLFNLYQASSPPRDLNKIDFCKLLSFDNIECSDIGEIIKERKKEKKRLIEQEEEGIFYHLILTAEIEMLTFLKSCCEKIKPSLFARAFGSSSAEAPVKASAQDREMATEIHRLISVCVPEKFTLTSGGASYREEEDKYMYDLIHKIIGLTKPAQIEEALMTGTMRPHLQKNKLFIVYILVSGLLSHYKGKGSSDEKDIRLVQQLTTLKANLDFLIIKKKLLLDEDFVNIYNLIHDVETHVFFTAGLKKLDEEVGKKIRAEEIIETIERLTENFLFCKFCSPRVQDKLKVFFSESFTFHIPRDKENFELERFAFYIIMKGNVEDFYVSETKKEKWRKDFSISEEYDEVNVEEVVAIAFLTMKDIASKLLNIIRSLVNEQGDDEKMLELKKIINDEEYKLSLEPAASRDNSTAHTAAGKITLLQIGRAAILIMQGAKLSGGKRKTQKKRKTRKHNKKTQKKKTFKKQKKSKTFKKQKKSKTFKR